MTESIDQTLGHRLLNTYSPIVAKAVATYLGLPQQAKLGALVIFAGLWHRYGGKILLKNGKIVTFLPSFVYEIVHHTFFWLNWVLDSLCYIQPEKSEWNEPNDTSVSVEALKAAGGVDLSIIKDQILTQKDVAYAEKDLVRLYDSLPAAKTEEILVGRTWNGKILRTKKSVLDLAEWLIIRPISFLGISWGKRYCTQHTGDPLLFNWAKVAYVPIPLWGNVCVTDIKWRGVPTGTMNYDAQNWKDYFRILEHDPATQRLVLLGVWTARSKAGGWFTLTWDPSTPTE